MAKLNGFIVQTEGSDSTLEKTPITAGALAGDHSTS